MSHEELSSKLIKSIESNLEKGFRVKDIVKHNINLQLISNEVIESLLSEYDNKFSVELLERGNMVDSKTQEIIVKMIEYDFKKEIQ